MTTTESNSRVRSRLLAAPLAVIALALASGTAFAAPAPAGPAAPSPAELAGAASAASTGPAVSGLATFFAQLDARTAGDKGLVPHAEKALAAAAAKENPRVSRTAQAVYVLNPAFVKGGSASVPVARFAFAAVGATSAKGVPASVWIGRDQHSGHWSVINTISGSDEVSYPGRAHGDLVFSEPQTTAWYRVHSGDVLPLNGPARAEVGKAGVPLATYRKLVHSRYADKLPGSGYRKAGMIGGFPTGASASSAGPDHRTSATASTSASTPASTPAALAGGGLAAAVACCGAWLIRRRYRSSV
ncbi:hypothetical protein [Streptomyces sp. NBC_01306]|uniref:hypothetical protein n=1 Tax=Streptomyces sp. NBC_01306 TaxID=2903819 RepID=UPI002253663C|nr:hypothetical protein [Streptomyces sp. NBC_01306]MCX4726767.1 hypothetical protein [Streptomyces sp. NBC_01306]